MKIESAVNKIITKLQHWTQGKQKLVVGIDGYSGVGKTTLAKHLAINAPNVEVIFMDDFVSTANTKERLIPQLKSNSNSLSLEWAPPDGLKKLQMYIQKFKARKKGAHMLVVEGIFLLHPDVLRDNLDKIIYLDANLKQADERRIKREKKRWGKDYFPETHPDSFARLFKIAHKRYRKLYKPKQNADVVMRMS